MRVNVNACVYWYCYIIILNRVNLVAPNHSYFIYVPFYIRFLSLERNIMEIDKSYLRVNTLLSSRVLHILLEVEIRVRRLKALRFKFSLLSKAVKTTHKSYTRGEFLKSGLAAASDTKSRWKFWIYIRTCWPTGLHSGLKLACSEWQRKS